MLQDLSLASDNVPAYISTLIFRSLRCLSPRTFTEAVSDLQKALKDKSFELDWWRA